MNVWGIIGIVILFSVLMMMFVWDWVRLNYAVPILVDAFNNFDKSSLSPSQNVLARLQKAKRYQKLLWILYNPYYGLYKNTLIKIEKECQDALFEAYTAQLKISLNLMAMCIETHDFTKDCFPEWKNAMIAYASDIHSKVDKLSRIYTPEKSTEKAPAQVTT